MSEQTKNNTEEKVFTRDELETIVEQRLSRERKNNEALSKIRTLLSELRRDEKFKSLSNAQIAQKLAELAANRAEKVEEQISDGVIPDTPQDTASEADINKDNDADLSAEPRAAKHSDGKNAAAAEKMQPEEDGGANEDPESRRRSREISEFIGAYDEQTLVSAMRDSAFRAFCVGKSGSILSLYESYRAFLSALAESPAAKRYRNAEIALASTGFSGSASSAVDHGALLTENQKRLAEAAGMSYRRYAELLEQIPAKKLGGK